VLSGKLAIATLKASLKNGWKPGSPLPARLRIPNWREKAANNPGNPGNPGKTESPSRRKTTPALSGNIAKAF